MPWRFVGHDEQLGQVCRALESPAAGPIVLAGEQGMGKSALITRALAAISPKHTRIVLIRPAGPEPLSALQASLPGRVPASLAPDETARAVARALSRAPGRTLMVADDAHLIDHASMLALRALSRRGDAVLLASHLVQAQPTSWQDPTDCLAYERNLLSIALPPFTAREVGDLVGHLLGGTVRTAAAEALAVATGGNPRVLRELLVAEGLAGAMVARQGQWTLGAVDESARRGSDVLLASTARLAGAIGSAWQGLAIDRLDQLCRVALWCGACDQVDSIWPFLLLLRGCPDEAIEFIDSRGDGALAAKPQLAMTRALVMAIGCGQPGAAARFLLAAASSGVGPPGLLAAYRAWLLTVAGQAREAASALRLIRHGNGESALFVHAARAGVTRLGGNAAETVFHLRRALAAVENCPDLCPWMWPYLSECLADALVMAGRGSEVHSVGAGSRRRESASGRYVGDILHALALCCERGVPAITAMPAVPAG
ncbi:MAG TPA: ATP-binding protein [Trebonia sp.]|nr:ATP-binding protein [Trebonia sp.]